MSGHHFDLKVIIAPDGKLEVDASHPHIHGHDHAADIEGTKLSKETDAAMRAALAIMGIEIEDTSGGPKPKQPNGVPEGTPHKHRH
ncbi:MAG: hypothetical protein ACOYUZ_00910 [Patescibacteria group bacterium]